MYVGVRVGREVGAKVGRAVGCGVGLPGVYVGDKDGFDEGEQLG